LTGRILFAPALFPIDLGGGKSVRNVHRPSFSVILSATNEEAGRPGGVGFVMTGGWDVLGRSGGAGLPPNVEGGWGATRGGKAGCCFFEMAANPASEEFVLLLTE
jgi:hypothetical protein